MGSSVSGVSVPRATSGWLVKTIGRRPGRLEPCDLRGRLRGDPELREGDRGVRAAVAHERLDQHAVAIEEGRAAAHRRPGRPIATYSTPGKSATARPSPRRNR